MHRKKKTHDNEYEPWRGLHEKHQGMRYNLSRNSRENRQITDVSRDFPVGFLKKKQKKSPGHPGQVFRTRGNQYIIPTVFIFE